MEPATVGEWDRSWANGKIQRDFLFSQAVMKKGTAIITVITSKWESIWNQWEGGEDAIFTGCSIDVGVQINVGLLAS